MIKRQMAYDIVDEEFLSFINNNKGYGGYSSWLDKMKTGDIINIVNQKKESDNINSIDIMNQPWNIVYIAKSEGGEGPFYHFMDCAFNKLYSYYDVE